MLRFRFVLLCGSCVATVWTFYTYLGFDEIYQRLWSLNIQILKMPWIWQPWSYRMVFLKMTGDFCINL